MHTVFEFCVPTGYCIGQEHHQLHGRSAIACCEQIYHLPRTFGSGKVHLSASAESFTQLAVELLQLG
jgi:hypothetical protein